jgi:hypothetical protein
VEFDLRIAPGLGPDLEMLHVVGDRLRDRVSALITRLKGLRASERLSLRLGDELVLRRVAYYPASNRCGQLLVRSIRGCPSAISPR